MRFIGATLLAVAFSLCAWAPLSPARAQVDVIIRVDIEPPPLPDYDQPPIPEPGYLWVPGYWAWSDDDGYYWVPGTWVLPPEPELLWTPGYWGWDDGVYLFHPGYWGPTVGFYGGVVYGFGYTGYGYEGGYWRDRQFFYNRTVNNITNVRITNVYSKTVIVNKTNVGYNGGAGGITAKPTPEQLAAEKQHHVAPTAEQTHHAEVAAKDPTLTLANNHGHPTVAATVHPGSFTGPGTIAARPGKPILAVSPKGHSGPSIGHGAVTAPGNEREMEKRGPGTGPQPEVKKLPPRVTPPPPPPPHAVAHPPPPPPAPRTASPPPRRAPPPPPPPRPAPPPKPKCEPGKHC